METNILYGIIFILLIILVILAVVLFVVLVFLSDINRGLMKAFGGWGNKDDKV